MKRQDLEDQLTSMRDSCFEMIDRAPRRAVVAAFGLGVVTAVFPDVVFPLIIVLGAAVTAYWYLCDGDAASHGDTREASTAQSNSDEDDASLNGATSADETRPQP